MIDREKVIGELKEGIDFAIHRCHCGLGVTMEMALALLKVQELVKVKHHDISNADDTTFDDEFWCEGCGIMWQAEKEEVNFCPGCGKAVKWDA